MSVKSQYSASFDLKQLNGANGFVLNGIHLGDQSGYPVSSAGDVNGDGLADLLIGADIAGNTAGQSYVVFGSRSAWPSSFSLSALNGANGFMLNGINPGDYSGVAVSSGDVNGDGLADLLISASGVSNNAGQSYVVFGSRSAWPSSFSLSTLNGSNGFMVNGINAGDQSGSAVSSAGDVNGDGVADLLIGAIVANDYAGQSYLMFLGGQTFSLSANQLNISNGGSVILNATDLLTDPTINTLLFSVSDLTHGQFEGVTNPGIAITQFAQLQLSNREVVFHHDGSNIAPQYGITCSHGLLEIAVQMANISFIPGIMNDGAQFLASYSLSTLNGAHGFVVPGINRRDHSGW
jgi:hypothetical protein